MSSFNSETKDAAASSSVPETYIQNRNEISIDDAEINTRHNLGLGLPIEEESDDDIVHSPSDIVLTAMQIEPFDIQLTSMISDNTSYYIKHQKNQIEKEAIAKKNSYLTEQNLKSELNYMKEAAGSHNLGGGAGACKQCSLNSGIKNIV